MTTAVEKTIPLRTTSSAAQPISMKKPNELAEYQLLKLEETKKFRVHWHYDAEHATRQPELQGCLSPWFTENSTERLPQVTIWFPGPENSSSQEEWKPIQKPI